MNNSHVNLFDVTDRAFQLSVLTSKLPAVVYFFANWSEPCRTQTPIYEKLSDEYVGKLLFVSIDIDANEATAARFKIQTIPTFLVFRAGSEIGRIIGGQNATHLKREIDKILSKG